MKRIIIAMCVAAIYAAPCAAQRTTTTYRGIAVRTPAPYGEAGEALQANFKALADRLGNHVEAADDPTADDDSAGTGGEDVCMYLSTWRNTADNGVWICLDASEGAAVWVELTGDGGSGGSYTAGDYLSLTDAEFDVTPAAIPIADLLGYGTMASQGAGAVAITGGTIDGTPLGGTTPAAAKATTLETTGRVGVGTAPDASYWFTLRQTAAYYGLAVRNIAGNRTMSFAFDSGTNAFISVNDALYFYGGNGFTIYTAAGKTILSKSDTQQWADAAGNVRVTLNGTTGNWSTTGTMTSAGAATANGSRLVEATIEAALPAYTYAVEGQECNIYLDNVFLTSPRGSWEWDVATLGSLGTQFENRWALTPTDEQCPGTDTIYINPKLGKYEHASSQTSLVLTDLDAGSGVTRKVLVIGDSTGSEFLPELENLFDGDAMTVDFVGTQTVITNDSEGASHSVSHESHSGWSWTTFTGSSSPFWDGGEIDFAWYLTENSISLDSDDWVICAIGINDIFPSSSDAGVQTTLDALAAKIDTIIGTGDDPAATTVRGAVPGIRVCICIPIAPSESQDAMGNNYGSGYHLWRYKRNLKLLQQWYLTNYDTAAMRAKDIYVLGLHENLDTVYNMLTTVTAVNARNAASYAMQSNGVHPAPTGYYQMADSYFAFLKANE